MRLTVRRAIVAALVLVFLLGNSGVAFAGTQVHVHLSSGSHVSKVTVVWGGTSYETSPNGAKNLWATSDGGQYVSDILATIIVEFDDSSMLTYHHPDSSQQPKWAWIGGEGGGTINVGLDGVVPPVTRGSITVSKIRASGSQSFPGDTSFTIRVTGTDYNQSQTVTENGSVTFHDLLPGSYHVEEVTTGLPAGFGTPTYDPSSGTVNVEAGKDSKVTVTNTYTAPGSIKLTKQVNNVPLDFDLNTWFYFTLSRGATPVSTKQVKAGSFVTWSNLEPGLYTITEHFIGANWDSHSPINVDVTSGDIKEITVTNNYTPPSQSTANITVEKRKAEGSENFPDGATFWVQVRRVGWESEWQQVLLGSTYTFTDLVADDYEVYEEIRGTFDGAFGPECINPKGFNLAEGQTQTVTITNSYTPTGTITVYKDVVEDSDPFDANKQFTVGVRRVAEAAAMSVMNASEIPAQTVKNGGSTTFSGLEPGLYEVYEMDPGTGWKNPLYLYNDSRHNEPVVVEVESGGEHEVTILNEYHASTEPPVTQYSSLTVKYMLSGTTTELRPSDNYTREVGTALTVTAPAIGGYQLRAGESSSRTHQFSNLDGQITFWYVTVEVEDETIIDEPPPLLPGTGGMAASALYGIGISLVSLGMVLRRKRH